MYHEVHTITMQGTCRMLELATSQLSSKCNTSPPNRGVCSDSVHFSILSATSDAVSNASLPHRVHPQTAFLLLQQQEEKACLSAATLQEVWRRVPQKQTRGVSSAAGIPTAIYLCACLDSEQFY